MWEVLPLRRKEQQRQCAMNWPQSIFPVPLHRSGEGGRETGVKLSSGRREGWGKGISRSGFNFSSHYPTLILIGDELNSLFSPSSVCFVRDSNWWVISPCPYLDPRAFHYTSSLPSSWGRGVVEQLWWAPGIYPGQTKTPMLLNNLMNLTASSYGKYRARELPTSYWQEQHCILLSNTSSCSYIYENVLSSFLVG